jgi:Mg/Co/Ni transporter MgtE
MYDFDDLYWRSFKSGIMVGVIIAFVLFAMIFAVAYFISRLNITWGTPDTPKQVQL